MEVKLRVANMTLTYRYNYDTYLKKSPFFYEIHDSLTTDYILSVEIKPNIIKQDIEAQVVLKNRYYVTNDLMDIVEVRHKEQVSQRVTFDKVHKNVKIELNDSLVKDVAMQEYILSGMMFLEIALLEGFTPLHASAFKYRDDAILISAPSGTGKSTHASFWKTHYAQDVEMINDDKPLIYKHHDTYYVTGTPFSGKSSLNQNIQAKLNTIVFLKQGKSNHIEELEPKLALQYLLQNTMRPKDVHVYERLLHSFDDLIKTTKILEFHAVNDVSAAHFLHNYIYGGQNEN